MTNNLLDNLNEPQREAVTTINGPLQIIAGAGSGKTRVLTYRIAYLLSQGVNPWNIMALTFTNKAAKEIKHRISQVTAAPAGAQRPASDSIYAGTFHSVFARLLRQDAAALGYSSHFTIYDVDDAVRALKVAKAEYRISTDIKDSTIYAAISGAKNRMIMPDKYEANAYTAFERDIGKCYDAYQKTLLKNNAMDFDDILVNMLQVLYLPEIAAKYHDKFHYILIDEYQDTNRVQHAIVKELAKHRQNLCVVGDDAQSIYRWRGADIGGILNFAADYPTCKTVKLEQNYRSTKNILKAADSLIKHNKKQLQKNLWTDNEDGPKIELTKYQSDRAEAEETINQIKSNPTPLANTAILYRTNAQALAFEKACRSANLLYVLVGGTSFYKRKEIKDTIAYLRLITNPNDDIAAARVINEPPRGVGKAALTVIADIAAKHKKSFMGALKILPEERIPRRKIYGNIMAFSELVATHTALETQNLGHEHLNDYIKATGMLAYYEEVGDAEAEDRIRNIEQLLTDMAVFFNENENATLEDYLEQISLINDLDTKDLTADRLTLMTLHSAKGLEFDSVYIAGIEAGIMPLASVKTEAEADEERRLFYVGITRARKQLMLSYSATRFKFGQLTHNLPSIFLKELSPETLNDRYGNTFLSDKSLVDKAAAFEDLLTASDNYSQLPPGPPKDLRKSWAYQSQRPQRAKPNRIVTPANAMRKADKLAAEAEAASEQSVWQKRASYGSSFEQPFSVGQPVKHPRFGRGRVTSVSGPGLSAKVTVHFAEFGRKVLLLQYANLEMADEHEG